MNEAAGSSDPVSSYCPNCINIHLFMLCLTQLLVKWCYIWIIKSIKIKQMLNVDQIITFQKLRGEERGSASSCSILEMSLGNFVEGIHMV